MTSSLSLLWQVLVFLWMFTWHHREKVYWTVGLIGLSVFVSWTSFHFNLRF